MNLDYLLYSEKDILERVDEYTLYCFYLKYEPLIGAKYPCPYRDDPDPSWGIFEPTRNPTKGETMAHEFMWSDRGKGEHGNIFGLVQRLFKYPERSKALLKVCADHGLGGHNDDVPCYSTKEKKYVEPVDISIVSKPFNERELHWWKQFNIGKGLLEWYQVTSIKCYWSVEGQTYPSYPANNFGFAYREYDKYQLYFPLALKEKKFRNNFTDVCVHGYKQLDFNNPSCIITKSRKDVMCLRSFGYNAIAPRSESTMLPVECIQFLKRKFPFVKILFDNDMKHNGENYEFEKIYVPVESGTKDISDYCKVYGRIKTNEILKTILQL